MLTRSFLAAGMALMLSGCALFAKPEPVIVYKTRYVLLEPPSSLTKVTPVARPPAADAYVASTWDKKESLLIDFGSRQTTQLQMCNRDKKDMDDWITKTRAKYAGELN